MDVSDSEMFYGGRFVGCRADWMRLTTPERHDQNVKFYHVLVGIQVGV